MYTGMNRTAPRKRLWNKNCFTEYAPDQIKLHHLMSVGENRTASPKKLILRSKLVSYIEIIVEYGKMI